MILLQWERLVVRTWLNGFKSLLTEKNKRIEIYKEKKKSKNEWKKKKKKRLFLLHWCRIKIFFKSMKRHLSVYCFLFSLIRNWLLSRVSDMSLPLAFWGYITKIQSITRDTSKLSYIKNISGREHTSTMIWLQDKPMKIQQIVCHDLRWKV